jgi:ABC-2 type transport system ATP-binding protein
VVGVLTEHHGLYGRMNAEEYLQFFGELYGLSRAQLRPSMNGLLEQFGLDEARKKRLGEYSKGMRQKLALVRAMLHAPPVLLLDEPTSAMDPESARTVRDAIHSLVNGSRAMILCTHNLAEAEELADQVAIIRRGKILFCDTPEGLKQRILGPLEYEARLSENANGWDGDSLPLGVRLVARGDDRLRFHVDRPDEEIPGLLAALLAQSLKVVAFQPVQRSLEQAYLAAMQTEAG